MITHKIGDLIQAFKDKEVESLAHQANCYCKMRSGFAKNLVDVFVEAAIVDGKTITGDLRKMGTFSVAKVKEGYIFNQYSQFHYGNDVKQTDYAAFKTAQAAIRDYMTQHSIKSIGMPKLMGCGLAGGDWNIVLLIIEETFKDTEIEVIIYELKNKNTK